MEEKINKIDSMNNKHAEKILLDSLGTFDCVSTEEVDNLFDQLHGFIFKIKDCLFRVSYINEGRRRRFTAELINEEKKD